MNFFKKNGAGLLLCLLIAIPSWLLGKAVPVVGGPVFSIVLPHRKGGDRHDDAQVRRQQHLDPGPQRCGRG